MICITVTPVSRTLAKADLLNAARRCDIIELCLDHFINEPDVRDLITAVDKPMIVSCRRPEEGGQWQGTEDERLMLLRQAIAASPAYVELDLETARRVPRYGKTKRLISFTRLDGPETNLPAVMEAAAQVQADIVKCAWPTPTLDAAWPLLSAVTQKNHLPVVGLGFGRAEITFSLLGRKYGSPWIYAALEQGMQAWPGQTTVFELQEIYQCEDIQPKTTFVGVAGFGESQTLTIKVLNAGFRQLNSPARCLPIELGETRHLAKMLDILKIRALIVQSHQGEKLLPLVEHMDARDRACGHVNLLLKREDGWHGYNTLWRGSLEALQTAQTAAGRKIAGQSALIIGNGGIALSMIHALQQAQGLVSLCGPGDQTAQRQAGERGCRFVPFQNLYETLADLVILADPNIVAGSRHGQINPSLLRPGMTVMDVGNLPLETELVQEARQRGARVVESAGIYSRLLNEQFKVLTGRDLPAQAYAAILAE
jgi:3-dehydroquinate dehydratase/shikimate dehydrogenase